MPQKNTIEDACTYWIEIRGQVEENDLNAASPLQLDIEQTGEDCTLLCVETDQSGLVGLIRHLHGLGFVLLSVNTRPKQAAETGLS